MKPYALILAGGEGRRLGGLDKALLRLGDRPLLDHVLAALRPQVARIALSAAGDPSRFAGFGLPVLDDGVHRGAGPLAGLLAGLTWAAAAKAEALLTVPVDTPFIPADLAAKLDAPPATACCHGRVHHLVALWPVAARDRLAAFLVEGGSRRVADFAAMLGMREMDFGQPAAGEADPFANINTPADLAAAAARLG